MTPEIFNKLVRTLFWQKTWKEIMAYVITKSCATRAKTFAIKACAI